MSDFIFPTSARGVSDSFQDHVNRGSVNPGTDYTAGYGSDVVAVASGTVTDSDNGTGGSGGRTIHIDHDNGWGTDYLHLSSADIAVGSHVSQGQRIGASGASGYGQNNYYGPHLHISLRPNHSHGYWNDGNVDFALHVGPGGGGDTGGKGNITSRPTKDVQTALAAKGIGIGSSGVDGVYGPDTTAAVAEFQKEQGLAIDGVYGPATDAKLFPAAPTPPAPGDNGWRGIQQMLKALYGYTGAIDGIPGSGTWSAMQRFVKTNWGYTGPIDGVASSGGNTWKATQRWLQARYGYTGAIDGIPGAGTNAALVRAGAANDAAF